eukprot:ctg_2806.g523
MRGDDTRMLYAGDVRLVIAGLFWCRLTESRDAHIFARSSVSWRWAGDGASPAAGNANPDHALPRRCTPFGWWCPTQTAQTPADVAAAAGRHGTPPNPSRAPPECAARNDRHRSSCRRSWWPARRRPSPAGTPAVAALGPVRGALASTAPAHPPVADAVERCAPPASAGATRPPAAPAARPHAPSAVSPWPPRRRVALHRTVSPGVAVPVCGVAYAAVCPLRRTPGNPDVARHRHAPTVCPGWAAAAPPPRPSRAAPHASAAAARCETWQSAPATCTPTAPGGSARASA